MSVLIKGIEMPINCYYCPFIDYEEGFCLASGVKHESGWYESTLCPGGIKDKRHEDCPLIPVPPHGRLIDADAACEQLEKHATVDGQPRAIRRARRIVAEMPTIIPAEEGGGGCGRCDHCRIPYTGTCRYGDEEGE